MLRGKNTNVFVFLSDGCQNLDFSYAIGIIRILKNRIRGIIKRIMFKIVLKKT